MSPLKPDDARAKEIDRALASWRQGDLAFDPSWLLHVADGDAPLTEHSESEQGPHSVTREVRGVVVLTQTCDIVRSCIERPFIQVAPLVDVDEGYAAEVADGLHPQFAPIATQAKKVANLDEITTVEKSIVASWSRTPGWSTDEESRRFADGLVRKSARFPFPDDFAVSIRKLRDRIRKKHDKQTVEGEALRLLREIRVTATPGWAAARVDIFVNFVRLHEAASASIKWDEQLASWLALCVPSGRIASFAGRVTTLEGMHAREYVESDRLDLDHLSTDDEQA